HHDGRRPPDRQDADAVRPSAPDPGLVSHVGLLGIVTGEVEHVLGHVHEGASPGPDDEPVEALLPGHLQRPVLAGAELGRRDPLPGVEKGAALLGSLHPCSIAKRFAKVKARSPVRGGSMTYSIVAVDRPTGEVGVAVQSHWFSVGPLVPWAEPGVGAVATQANVDVAYGPRGLDRLRDGL